MFDTPRVNFKYFWGEYFSLIRNFQDYPSFCIVRTMSNDALCTRGVHCVITCANLNPEEISYFANKSIQHLDPITLPRVCLGSHSHSRWRSIASVNKTPRVERALISISCADITFPLVWQPQHISVK